MMLSDMVLLCSNLSILDSKIKIPRVTVYFLSRLFRFVRPNVNLHLELSNLNSFKVFGSDGTFQRRYLLNELKASALTVDFSGRIIIADYTNCCIYILDPILGTKNELMQI